MFPESADNWIFCVRCLQSIARLRTKKNRKKRDTKSLSLPPFALSRTSQHIFHVSFLKDSFQKKWNFVHVNWLAFVPLQYRLIVASYELFFFLFCVLSTHLHGALTIYWRDEYILTVKKCFKRIVFL